MPTPVALDPSGARDPARPQRPRRTWARRALVWVAWALVVALLAQVFTAGMAVFVSPAWWARHRSFVHAFEWMPLVAVVLALIARAPRAVVALAGGTVLLIAVQYTTAHLRLAPGTQVMAALHPVSAVLLVWATGELARRVTGWSGRERSRLGTADSADRRARPGGSLPPATSVTPVWTAALRGR